MFIKLANYTKEDLLQDFKPNCTRLKEMMYMMDYSNRTIDHNTNKIDLSNPNRNYEFKNEN